MITVAIRLDGKNSLFGFKTEKDAKAFIKDIKKAYPKAQYMIGKPIKKKK